MKTYREILEANIWYYHIVLEPDGKHHVIHSSHNHPRLGGQEIRAFPEKDRKKAIQWALKFKDSPKDVVITWKQVGHGAKAQWHKGGEFTKTV